MKENLIKKWLFVATWCLNNLEELEVCLVRNPMWSSLIHFDPFWTDLIRSDLQFEQICQQCPGWKHLKMENHSICGIGYARHWWSCWKGEAAIIVLFVSGPGYIVSFSVEICPRVCPNGICPRVCPNGRTPPAMYARGFVPTANYAPGSVPTAATSRLPDSRSNQVSYRGLCI